MRNEYAALTFYLNIRSASINDRAVDLSVNFVGQGRTSKTDHLVKNEPKKT